MPSYRDRYAQFKDEVDAEMGRPRGRWARFKTRFLPNSFSSERKRAIDEADAWNALRAEMEARAAKLYQTHNIIGATEIRDDRPTVYYRSNSGTYGHITQWHQFWDNLGREAAEKHPGYSCANTGPRGEFEEKLDGRVIHQSRRPFVSVENDEQRESLARAHRNFPRLKEISLKQARERVAKCVVIQC